MLQDPLWTSTATCGDGDGYWYLGQYLVIAISLMLQMTLMSQPLCFATQRARWVNYRNPRSKLGYILTHFLLQHSCCAFNPMEKYVIASQMSQGCSEFSREQRGTEEPNACKGRERHTSCEEKALSYNDLMLR